MIKKHPIKGPESEEGEFRLRFAASSPVSEVVLSQRGLFGNILIRGENFGGRNQALVTLCGDAAMAGFGVIYITEGISPTHTKYLRTKASEAFGPTRYQALNVGIEPCSLFLKTTICTARSSRQISLIAPGPQIARSFSPHWAQIHGPERRPGSIRKCSKSARRSWTSTAGGQVTAKTRDAAVNWPIAPSPTPSQSTQSPGISGRGCSLDRLN